MVEDTRRDRQDEVGQPSTERVSVAQAADHLGTTVDAIRKRVQRGTIPHEKDAAGRVWILLDTGRPRQDATGHRPDARDVLVETLREQIGYLQGVIATRDQELAQRAEEIRRRDAALEREQKLAAFYSERLQALEAPARAAPEASEETPQSPESPRPSATPPAESGGHESGAEGRPRWLLIVALLVLAVLLFLGLAANAFISQPGGLFGG